MAINAETSPDIIQQFGSLLFEYRSKTGLSRNKLALKIGVDPSFMSRMEHGSRLPSSNITHLIINGLGLEPPDSDRLLVAAGYAPSNLEGIGWEDTLARVKAVLTRPDISEADMDRYRQIIIDISDKWLESTPS